MSRLIFTHAQVLDGAGSPVSNQTIYGITVEGTELTKEATTVEIEDGRTLNESFTGSITIRSINSNFGQGGIGTDILASAYISDAGSLETKGGLKLFGAGSSPDISITGVYLNGHRDFSNGRLETVITATKEDSGQGVLVRS